MWPGLQTPTSKGYGFDVSYSLENSGTWEELIDGGKLWRLKIKSQDACSINLIYDKFCLPEGANFFIYNNDKSMVIGTFTFPLLLTLAQNRKERQL